jgi:hypothetical protein
MGREFAAFISYSSRYKEWVRCLQANLELALAAHGETRKVFLDQTDLGAGQSWVAGLQAGFDQADQLILVVTPEALASPRVADEVEPFVAENRDWVGRLQLAVLVDAPLPPILSRIQKMDFEGHDATKYRGALSKLLGGVLGERGGRRQPALPQGIEIPDPPAGQAPREARQRLVKWLGSIIEEIPYRVAVASVLGLEPAVLAGHPSSRCAASAAIVAATGDDDRVAAVRRIIDALRDLFRQDRKRLEPLEALASELSKVDRGSEDLLGLWLNRVRRDNSELLPYFDQQVDRPLLDQIYVQLQLASERRRTAAAQAAETSLHLDGSFDHAGRPGSVGPGAPMDHPIAGSCSAIPGRARRRWCATWPRASRASRARSGCRCSIRCRA